MTEIPVKKNVAMTGEITLRGRVLPVGGIKEKILAARRAGIDIVIIPSENEKDIEEISENIRGKYGGGFRMCSRDNTKIEDVITYEYNKSILYKGWRTPKRFY